MNKHITKTFNLPPSLWLDKIENEEKINRIILHCRSQQKQIACCQCKTKTKKIHQMHFREIKHSMIDQKQIILSLKVRRFKCKKCGKIFREKINGIDRKKTSTNFRCQALTWLQRNSFNYIATKFQIAPSTLTRYLINIFNVHKIDWFKNKITKLGIDEHSFKGRKLLITITDLSNHKLLAILKNDNKATLEKFLNNIAKKAKERLNEVCIDLNSGYKNAIKKCLPNVAITADRFHVERLIKRTLDDIRQIVQDEEGKRKIHLKEALLKDEKKLNKRELERLNFAFEKYKNFPVLKETWFIKEKVRKFYWSKNQNESKKKFEEIIMLLQTAHQSKFLETTLKTFMTWKKEILNYFENKTTNGFTEGCHTKIKMIKRVSFGFNNINNYIAKISLAFLPLLWVIHYHSL